MPSTPNDILLATGWPVSKVRRSLRQKKTSELVTFIRGRHNERFFEPIRCLKKVVGNEQGFGFAMMALCSLLVETIQSYRDGLPTTYAWELNRLRRLTGVPASFRIPAALQVNGKKAFQRFFRKYHCHFPQIGGARFYKNVRNGLLHQGQTKARWTISKKGGCVFDADHKVLYRDQFADALQVCFEEYLTELEGSPWTQRAWVHASRKIWWLIRLSQ